MRHRIAHDGRRHVHGLSAAVAYIRCRFDGFVDVGRRHTAIGAPDAEAGEIPKAYVVPQSGITIQIDSLAEWVNRRLAAYKAIGCWEIVAKVPRTASGKILRRELKRSILEN